MYLLYQVSKVYSDFWTIGICSKRHLFKPGNSYQINKYEEVEMLRMFLSKT